MIENIRRYTGLIFVVIVLLLLGFIFMDAGSMLRSSAGGGGTILSINGRGYSQKDYNNLGVGPLRLASALRGMDQGSFEMMRFMQTLAAVDDAPANVSQAEYESLQARRFFVNRMLLREARDEFGVHPSDAEVAEFIQGLAVFGSQPQAGAMPGMPGEFDQTSYNQFIQQGIGRFGLSESDFQELVRDVIAGSKLREIIGGGLPGNRSQAEAMAVVDVQALDAIISPIDKASFRESIDPSEEELRTYWELVKDAYLTEKRIKVSYLLLSPEQVEAEESPADAEEDAAAEDAENAAEEDPELAERKAEAEKQLAIDVDGFLIGLEDSDGSKFESLAGEHGWDLVATDWFTRDEVPADLQLQPRGTSVGVGVTQLLFDLRTGPDPLAPFTKAVAVGEDQWFIARLDEVEESRVKTFEEAEEELRADYIDEKADEKLDEFVTGKIAALKEKLEAGEGYAEAAEALELEVKDLRSFTVSESLDNEFEARAIFQASATTNPGELADPLYQEDRAVIIYVEDRTIVKDDNRGQQVDNYLSNLGRQNENAAFAAWIDQRFVNSRIDGPALR